MIIFLLKKNEGKICQKITLYKMLLCFFKKFCLKVIFMPTFTYIYKHAQKIIS